MQKEHLLLRTLYTTEFGSRLYGTDTDQSDLDIKYIFLPPLQNVLLGKQVLKSKFVSPNLLDKSKQVDEDFIPVQKFAMDFLKGVPYAVEVAFSTTSPSTKILSSASLFPVFLNELKKNFLNKKLSGFLGFINQMNKEITDAARNNVLADQQTAKNAYHGMRVAEEAFQLLTTRSLVFPFDKKLADYFKAVKYGDERLSTTKYVLDSYVKKVDAALRATTLQELTPELEEEFEKWLFMWIRKFYSI